MGELARNNSMDLILKKMSAFNPKNLPLVFMGDFNSLPGSAAVEKVKSTMVNCHEASVSGHFGPEGTFNGFKFNEPVTKLIDYIFVSKSNKIKILKHAFLSDNKNLRYPSDHFPVFAEIILRK
jgi:endonuclease/exonuclease/phosphatase family metal-dependent hydrolase